jgi:hypothetical protein
MQQEMQLTVKAFHEENPIQSLMQRTYGEAFERGLPVNVHLLTQPDVVVLFRTLLRDGMIKSWKDENEAIEKCHRHGWINSEEAKPPDRYAFVYYVLPSPFHAAYLSWRLQPTDDMPHFTTILDLSLTAISKLKPSQMHVPMFRVGAAAESTNLSPEAQYRDEFYRSLFSVTSGNVRITPEFASSRGVKVVGSIDFFIPVVNWGIEITQDGNWLTEYSSSFVTYGERMNSDDMVDYIILDCRTSTPKNPHPSMFISELAYSLLIRTLDIPNLFHVVFGDEYQEVVLYDHMLRQVGGRIALRENV